MGEVHMKARSRRQSVLHARMLVRGIVVHDHVDVQFPRHVLFDLPQKVPILLVAMMPPHCAITVATSSAANTVIVPGRGNRT